MFMKRQIFGDVESCGLLRIDKFKKKKVSKVLTWWNCPHSGNFIGRGIWLAGAYKLRIGKDRQRASLFAGWNSRWT